MELLIGAFGWGTFGFLCNAYENNKQGKHELASIQLLYSILCAFITGWLLSK